MGLHRGSPSLPPAICCPTRGMNRPAEIGVIDTILDKGLVIDIYVLFRWVGLTGVINRICRLIVKRTGMKVSVGADIGRRCCCCA